MSNQLDLDDPRYRAAAARILRRHDEFEPEANITSAVRDFLILTGLAKPEEIVEEAPPARGSGRAVDLTALNTFIEVKRRIGTAGSFNPNAEYVQQLDDYQEESEKQGRMRMGILTDGKQWLLRWPSLAKWSLTSLQRREPKNRGTLSPGPADEFLLAFGRAKHSGKGRPS